MTMGKQERIFFIAAALIIAVSALLLHPSISTFLIPAKRMAKWYTFKKTIVNNNYVDGQTFWKFRESYYPGYFTFKPRKLEPSIFNPLFSSSGVSFKSKSAAYPFLYFYSGRIRSVEGMTTLKTLKQLFSFTMNSKTNLINTSTTLFSEDENSATLVFVEPIEEMKKTNAHYDYRGEYKELIKKYNYWFVVTEITIP